MSGVGGDQNGSKKRVTNEIAFVWWPGTLLQMNEICHKSFAIYSDIMLQ